MLSSWTGKTTVIAPLLVMMLADGHSLVTIAVPSALLEQSRVIFMSKFSNILKKRVYMLDFDRFAVLRFVLLFPGGSLVRLRFAGHVMRR